MNNSPKLIPSAVFNIDICRISRFSFHIHRHAVSGHPNWRQWQNGKLLRNVSPLQIEGENEIRHYGRRAVIRRVLLEMRISACHYAHSRGITYVKCRPRVQAAFHSLSRLVPLSPSHFRRTAKHSLAESRRARHSDRGRLPICGGRQPASRASTCI